MDERFKKNCCVLRFGDGNIEGGGKSSWLSLKTPDIEPLLSHIHTRDEAIRKATIREVIEMVEGMVRKMIKDEGEEMSDVYIHKMALIHDLDSHLQSYLKDNK